MKDLDAMMKVNMKDLANLDKRLVSIGKQLEKNPNDSDAWAAKADILSSLGLHEIALRCCNKSLELNPYNMLTWITKGEALKKLERNKEAYEAFAKANSLAESEKR